MLCPRATVFAMLVLLGMLCGMGAVRAASAAGVPSAVWQDSERGYRKPAGIPLAQEQRQAEVAKMRTTLARAGDAQPGLHMRDAGDWRLRIREAAVVSGNMVTLGEIADPLGPIPPDVWRQLSAQALWPAPGEPGRPLQVNKARLQQALREVLGPTADRCLVPTALAVQRGGLVLREEDLRSYVVRFLTPQMAALPGTAELTDFRLPPYIFLEHPQQKIGLEPGKIVPGRISLRFVVQEMDGTVLRRVAGTVVMALWMEVPAAARSLGKGEHLRPDDVTFIRMNVAHLKGMPWDGRGGPWQVLRGIGTGQPIFQSDLATQAMVRKGSMVELVYEKGNVNMSVQAESMADGEPGATIPVRNLQSKRQVYATVRDNKTVVAQ